MTEGRLRSRSLWASRGGRRAGGRTVSKQPQRYVAPMCAGLRYRVKGHKPRTSPRRPNLTRLSLCAALCRLWCFSLDPAPAPALEAGKG